MKIASSFLLLISFSFWLIQRASACNEAQSDTGQVVLRQHIFDDGLQELAIIYQEFTTNKKVTRLSFAGSKEASCHFPSFKLIKGGDWGWHVVWTSSANQGVFYARVDGEAWVSSLPRKLSRTVAEKVTLKEMQGKLIITAKYPANLNLPDENFISDDEGRSWDKPLP